MSDKELTPRAVFSISLDEIAVRTIDLDNLLGDNTVASHTMKVYDSDGTDVTSTIGEESDESSGTLTFGVNGATAGTYTIVFIITCDQETPSETAITFPVEVVLVVGSSAKTATSTAAETLVSYALLTLNDLKASLQIAFSTTTYDTGLALMINDATARIEKICQRRFKQTTYTTETYDGTGTPQLWIRNPPIISVDLITVDNETISLATDYDDYDGYRIEPQINGHKMYGMLYLSNGWDAGEQNVEITYSGGYTTIPDDIRRAAVMMIREWYNMFKNTEGYKSESIKNYSYSFDTLPDTVKKAIDDCLAPYILDYFK